MSNGNDALALALGAGAGFGLWYLLRDDDDGNRTPPDASPAPAPTSSPATASTTTTMTAPAPAKVAGGCSLRLDASGLTADGARVDVPTAVTRCKAAGRADLVLTDDAPGAVYLDLTTALAQAGVVVSARRNSVSPRRARRRRQARHADGRNATTYRHFTLRSYPEGRAGLAALRWFRADPPTTWADARDRLIAAGTADAEAVGRPHKPGGWMLSVDPADYRHDRAESLP